MEINFPGAAGRFRYNSEIAQCLFGSPSKLYLNKGLSPSLKAQCPSIPSALHCRPCRTRCRCRYHQPLPPLPDRLPPPPATVAPTACAHPCPGPAPSPLQCPFSPNREPWFSRVHSPPSLPLRRRPTAAHESVP